MTGRRELRLQRRQASNLAEIYPVKLQHEMRHLPVKEFYIGVGDIFPD